MAHPMRVDPSVRGQAAAGGAAGFCGDPGSRSGPSDSRADGVGPFDLPDEGLRAHPYRSTRIGPDRCESADPVEDLEDYVRRLRMSSKLYAQRGDSTDRSMS